MTPFILTDSAKTQMTYLLSKNPDKDAVHLAVKGGGCAGFKYEWGFVKNDNSWYKDWNYESNEAYMSFNSKKEAFRFWFEIGHRHYGDNDPDEH